MLCNERRLAAPSVVGDYDESTACLVCWEKGKNGCRLPCCQRLLCVDCLPDAIRKRKCPHMCHGVLDKANLFADAGIPPPLNNVAPEWLGREYFEGVHDIDVVENTTEEAVRQGGSGLWTMHRCRHCHVDRGMHWGMGEHDINSSSRTTCCHNDESELVAICLNNCVAVIDLVEVFTNARKKKFKGQVDAICKCVTMRTPGALRRLQVDVLSHDTASLPCVPTMIPGSLQQSHLAGMPCVAMTARAPRQPRTEVLRNQQVATLTSWW